MPGGQQERLCEVALRHAVDGQSIHYPRPWVVVRERDIWITKQKDEDTVYAFLTRIPDWPRGDRMESMAPLDQGHKWRQDRSFRTRWEDRGVHAERRRRIAIRTGG